MSDLVQDSSGHGHRAMSTGRNRMRLETRTAPPAEAPWLGRRSPPALREVPELLPGVTVWVRRRCLRYTRRGSQFKTPGEMRLQLMVLPDAVNFSWHRISVLIA